MLTATEMNNIVKQINDAFAKLEARIEKLENELAKETKQPAKKSTTKS